MSAYILYYNDLGLKPVYRQILSSLLLWDTAFLCSSFFLFSLRHLPYYRQTIFPHLAPLLFPLTQIFLVGSTYTIIALTVERVLATRVRYEHLHTDILVQLFQTRYKEPPRLAGYITIIFIFFFAFLINSSRFLEFKTLIKRGKYRLKPTELRKNPLYVSITMPVWIVVNNIIPMILLTLLNIKLANVLSERMKLLRKLNIQQVTL